ncbi:hypothetical protein [Telluria aromaticivorans]|uniref:DUF304 domain-containing protein n=1 Tax=Telluria aromaticivorans TaxID=2725995 RepID=A0A7Y2P0E5_9BURK|nr:hypothetical protein [Telluria aromaticivorans]NNG24867.1 hypothetical protein [Telluria aromaticivorans]
MELDKAATAAQAHVIGVKSWLAYAGVVALAVVLFAGALPLAFMWNEIAAAGVLAVSALLVAYRFLLVRSVQLYYDDVGVWVHSGVLPWKKGVSGVKWRDMDDATYVNGFVSWATRSYTVRIGHRFTKGSEIVLHNIARGRQAVETVNAVHQEMIRSGEFE